MDAPETTGVLNWYKRMRERESAAAGGKSELSWIDLLDTPPGSSATHHDERIPEDLLWDSAPPTPSTTPSVPDSNAPGSASSSAPVSDGGFDTDSELDALCRLIARLTPPQSPREAPAATYSDEDLASILPRRRRSRLQAVGDIFRPRRSKRPRRRSSPRERLLKLRKTASERFLGHDRARGKSRRGHRLST